MRHCVRVAAVSAAFVVVLPGIGLAADDSLASSSQSQTPPGALPTAARSSNGLAAGMVVKIETTQIISSKSNKRGDMFSLRLAEPIVVNGQIIVPSGVAGVGQVIDAQPAGLLGNPAKLVLAARYLDLPAGRLPLRSFKFGVTGQDNTTTVAALSAVPYAGLASFLVKGGDIDVPIGSRGIAKLAADGPIAPPSVQADTSPPRPIDQAKGP